MKKQYPEALKPGDRVGMFSPASPFDRNRFYSGIEIIRRMGFEPVFTRRVFYEKGYFAGSTDQRVRDIHEFFADTDIKALWAVRGGYGSLRLLPELDYDFIAQNPKIFIGCSDVSSLLNTLYRRCGMPAFHGPMVASLAEADEDTLKGLSRALEGDFPLAVNAFNGNVIREGRAEGPVLGGNLATICHLLATPYEPDFTGCILFIEDVGEKPYRIDRMLTQMMLAGCFDKIAGLAAGSFENCGPPYKLERILEDLFSKSRFPVISGFPAGHGRTNITLPFGVLGMLDSSSLSLTYQYPALSLSANI